MQSSLEPFIRSLSAVVIRYFQAAASQIQSLLRGRKDRQETDYKRAFRELHRFMLLLNILPGIPTEVGFGLSPIVCHPSRTNALPLLPCSA